jgi:hypothetical protein
VFYMFYKKSATILWGGWETGTHRFECLSALTARGEQYGVDKGGRSSSLSTYRCQGRVEDALARSNR